MLGEADMDSPLGPVELCSRLEQIKRKRSFDHTALMA
jgi:hypothetical protein